jgi:hypothetical protein
MPSQSYNFLFRNEENILNNESSVIWKEELGLLIVTRNSFKLCSKIIRRCQLMENLCLVSRHDCWVDLIWLSLQGQLLSCHDLTLASRSIVELFLSDSCLKVSCWVVLIWLSLQGQLLSCFYLTLASRSIVELSWSDSRFKVKFSRRVHRNAWILYWGSFRLPVGAKSPV